MRVLYLGQNRGTSGHRLVALKRLGHDVTVLTPELLIPQNRVLNYWVWHLGSIGLAEYIRKQLLRRIPGDRFDMAWVDHGYLLSDRFVRDLKQRIPIVVSYNIDDPFGGRDHNLWKQYLRAVPHYDLVVVVRRINIGEAYKAGAKRVMFVFMTADDIAHAPISIDDVEAQKWHSDVVFVGTGFAERGSLIKELIQYGVPLTIYGNQWNRLKEWNAIKPFWKGPGLEAPNLYAKAICSAKVCLGLLSKGNRDLHTTRSMEIPALGGVLCGERTVEHLALYRDREEAVFWNDLKECAELCRALLSDREWRESIASKGHQRFLRNNWTNIRMVKEVLEIACSSSRDPLDRYHASLPVDIPGVPINSC